MDAPYSFYIVVTWFLVLVSNLVQPLNCSASSKSYKLDVIFPIIEKNNSDQHSLVFISDANYYSKFQPRLVKKKK